MATQEIDVAPDGPKYWHNPCDEWFNGEPLSVQTKKVTWDEFSPVYQDYAEAGGDYMYFTEHDQRVMSDKGWEELQGCTHCENYSLASDQEFKVVPAHTTFTVEYLDCQGCGSRFYYSEEPIDREVAVLLSDTVHGTYAVSKTAAERDAAICKKQDEKKEQLLTLKANQVGGFINILKQCRSCPGKGTGNYCSMCGTAY